MFSSSQVKDDRKLVCFYCGRKRGD